MPKTINEELEGITLKIYMYVVNKKKPVGTREVTRGLNLSSPSVAYRHLEKLEELDLLQKDQFGEYTLKRKATLHGYMWVSRHLIPKMFVYSIVFASILIVELTTLALHFTVENFEFKVFFLLLILITGLSMAVFIIETLIQRRRSGQESKIRE
jgi:hypothetical protein